MRKTIWKNDFANRIKDLILSCKEKELKFYTICKYTSRDGMNAYYDVYILDDNDLEWLVSDLRLTGCNYSKPQEAVERCISHFIDDDKKCSFYQENSNNIRITQLL